MDRYTSATWKYEQIAFFYDESLTEDERLSLLAQATKKSVRWPNGEFKPIHRSTLYRWKAQYENPCKRCSERETCTKEERCEHRLQALRPKKRADVGKARSIKSEWVERAIYLLLERPKRSFGLLLILLATYFSDLDISRSTLSRRLKQHPLWEVVYRQRKGGKRRRRRFEAKKPHDIWHLDAKGPFVVKLQNGNTAKFVILTILEGHSRAVLATTLALSENLGAAVRLFRQAIERWGLPYRVYMDRASIYDSKAFRCGLAQLGIRRIRIKRKKGRDKRNPQPNGKIEAYHRVLENWFIQELPHQVVVDVHHLTELLQAFVAVAYQPHYHRELKMSPLEALGGRRSDRQGKSIDELDHAFRVRQKRKSHDVTGEISFKHGTFLVPAAYVGKKVDIVYDPAVPGRTFLVDDNDNEIPLKNIHEEQKPEKKKKTKKNAQGAGNLQRLVAVWRGRELPIAEAGFGLAEVCNAISERLGHQVPSNGKEAIAIQNFCRTQGPFASKDFTTALEKAIKAIGTKRPLKPLLDYLERLAREGAATDESEE
jgi:transposase InsO family protein